MEIQSGIKDSRSRSLTHRLAITNSVRSTGRAEKRGTCPEVKTTEGLARRREQALDKEHSLDREREKRVSMMTARMMNMRTTKGST